MDASVSRGGGRKVVARRVLAAALGPGLVSLLAVTEEHPPTGVVAVLFVLAVLVAARVGGAIAGIAASVLSFLSLNFFFTPPLHTFVVGTIEDLVALVVFLVVSVIVGLLVSTTVDAKSRAEQRELEARLLNRLATRLLSGEPTGEVLTGFARGLCEMFDLSRCEISTVVGDQPVSVTRGSVATSGVPEEIAIAAGKDQIGLISIWRGTERLTPDEQVLIHSMAAQLALALEGMRLSEEVRRAEVEARESGLKAALFSGVTHDVKTPLGSIMAAVTSLIDGGGFSDEERREHLDTIRHEADRLHRVVNNLLDVARLGAGALVVHKVATPVDEVVESVINRLRPLLGERPVDIRVAEGVPEAPMDVVQIDQVLTNLVENAARFTPPNTPISVAIVGNRRSVRVAVIDRGPGVAKDDRKRIFEPFERAATVPSGTGLGLAVSEAIVVAHDGRLWISETPGGGATFTFELPVGEEAIEAVTYAPASTGR